MTPKGVMASKKKKKKKTTPFMVFDPKKRCVQLSLVTKTSHVLGIKDL